MLCERGTDDAFRESAASDNAMCSAHPKCVDKAAFDRGEHDAFRESACRDEPPCEIKRSVPCEAHTVRGVYVRFGGDPAPRGM